MVRWRRLLRKTDSKYTDDPRSDMNTLESKTDANGNYASLTFRPQISVEADLPQHLEIAQTILSEPVATDRSAAKCLLRIRRGGVPLAEFAGGTRPDGNALPYHPWNLTGQPIPGRRAFARMGRKSQDLKKRRFVFDMSRRRLHSVYNDQSESSP